MAGRAISSPRSPRSRRGVIGEERTITLANGVPSPIDQLGAHPAALSGRERLPLADSTRVEGLRRPLSRGATALHGYGWFGLTVAPVDLWEDSFQDDDLSGHRLRVFPGGSPDVLPTCSSVSCISSGVMTKVF